MGKRLLNMGYAACISFGLKNILVQIWGCKQILSPKDVGPKQFLVPKIFLGKRIEIWKMWFQKNFFLKHFDWNLPDFQPN